MPTAERYWRDPEKHRAEFRNRRARLSALGVRWKDQRSYEAYKCNLEAGKKWGRENRKLTAAANRRYYAKLKRLYGVGGSHSIWRHTLERKEHELRQHKAAALSWRLVEARKPFNLLLSWPRRHRTAGVVLRGRDLRFCRPLHYSIQRICSFEGV